MGKKKVAQLTGDTGAGEQPKTDAAAVKTAAPATRKARRVEQGRIYIKSSYNNTVMTVTDMSGNVVAWATAGSIGFSGPKKATPFAASKVVAVVSEQAKNLGMGTVEVILRGIGSGRDSAVRSLANQGFTITAIKDVTPIPHNGPRARKVRRV